MDTTTDDTRAPTARAVPELGDDGIEPAQTGIVSGRSRLMAAADQLEKTIEELIDRLRPVLCDEEPRESDGIPLAGSPSYSLHGNYLHERAQALESATDRLQRTLNRVDL